MYKKLNIVSSNKESWVREIKNNKRNETVNNRCLLFSLKSNNFCIYILHKLTF